MRCKNCGTENDDNRYICENCGSPLYDDNIVNDDFSQNPTDSDIESYPQPEFQDSAAEGAPRPKDKAADNSDKKHIIVIAVLAVVLVAVIASVIVIASTKSRRENEVSSVPSSSQEITETQSTTKPVSTSATKPETTTANTTEETTTKAKTWSIKVVSKGGGTVSGAGNYKDGENVTITATADEGYEFDGWYSGGEKISSAPSYSFSAVENFSVSAVFNPVSTEPTAENIEGGLDQ